MPADGRFSSAPRVTAIIIFLNPGAYIEQAIESVLAQTREDWELILVDDGSSDDSPGIAARYERERPDRITLLRHPDGANHGMSVSRNLGLARARTEFVAFLDADDVWLPEKLERQVAILDAHPEAGMVFGPTTYWHSWSETLAPEGKDRLSRVPPEPGRMLQPPELLERILAGQSHSPATCAALLRVDAVRRVHGFEAPFRGMYEDQVFFAKIALHERIWLMPDSLDRYRQHHDSFVFVAQRTTDYAARRPHYRRYEYLVWLERYMVSHGFEVTIVWRLLRKETWGYRHPVLWRLRDVASRPVARTRATVKRLLKR
jgi:glycosyltransferase involved in cell wall biosynthesis